MRLIRSTIAVLAAVSVLTLAGCGGGDESGEDSNEETTSSRPAQAPEVDAAQLAAIQECLEAAGLRDAMPTGEMPTDMPTDVPTDVPTDGMPTDGMPTDGMPEGGGALADPEVQAALEACGIDLPAGPQ